MTIDVQAIKSALDDPRQLAEALGLIQGRRSYQKLASGILVRCVFHDEKTPSMSITRMPNDLRIHCFGCHANVDSLGLIAHVYGLATDGPRFGEVLERAAALAGISLDGAVPLPPRRAAPPEPPRLSLEGFAALGAVMARECPLAAQPDVCAYLDGRGLLEAAGDTLWALPANRAGLARVRDAIVAEVGAEGWQISGLASEHGWWLCPANRLCLPWRALDGAVRTIQRRRIDAHKPKFVFPRGYGSPTEPFGVEALARGLGPATEVAFVESALDVLAMRLLALAGGIDRVVLGVPSVTLWRQPWAKLAAARVSVVATDNDAQGEACAQRIATDLWGAGAIAVRREVPTGGAKDWASVTEHLRRGIPLARTA